MAANINTINQVADAQLKAARTMDASRGMLFIHREDLQQLLVDAAGMGYELGVAQANKPKKKLSKQRPVRSVIDDV